jgi:hypothetical protein
MGKALRLCVALVVCAVGAACGDDGSFPDAAPAVDSAPGIDATPIADAPPAPDAAIDATPGPADAAIDASVDATVDASVDAPVDAAIDAPIDASVDAPIDAPVDAPIDAPIDARVDASVDARVDAAVDARVDAAVDARVDASVDARVDAGIDAPVDAGAGGNPPPTGSCRGDWCWVYPLPQGNMIFAMWGASANDVWALADHGVLMRYRAGAWTTYELPQSSPIAGGGLWGSAQNDVWAGTPNGLYRWNGSTWTLAQSGSFSLVGGTGPDDVWASSGGAFMHWNGSTWTSRALPAGWTARAIGGTPGNVIVVSSNGGIARWRNNAWAIADGGSRTVLSADVIDDNHVVISQANAIAFWDTGTWTTHTTPVNAQWGPLSARSFSDVWFYGGVAAGDQRIYRWDGASFILMPDAGISQNASVLWVGSAGDVWSANLAAQVHSWTGSAWTEVTTGHNYGGSVAGTADDDIWLVPESGRMFETGNLVQHWDGASWSPSPFPFDASTYWLRDIAAVGPDDVWIAAGRWPSGNRIYRELLHWNGTTWTAFAGMGFEDAILEPVGFNSVWGSGPDDVYAVARGAVYHFDGDVWARVNAVPGGRQVFGSASNDVYIINGTTLYRWNGASWSSRTLSQEAIAGWSNGPTDVWISGYQNMMHFDGVFSTVLNAPYGLPIGTAAEMFTINEGTITRWLGGPDGTRTVAPAFFLPIHGWRSPSGIIYIAGRGLVRSQ